MATATGKLTAVQVKTAPPGKHFDGGGLFLDVKPNGSRYWRMKYRHGGKERLLAFGVFPEVTLSEARRRRDDARTAIRDGADPATVKRERTQAAKVAAANSFEAIAREWLETQRKSLAASTFRKAEWTLLEQVCPWLGARPISEITPPEVLAVLKRIEARGARDTAHRTKERCAQVFRYAIATGRADSDPCRDLRGSLAPPVRTSRAAVTDPAKVAHLLRVLDDYAGLFSTRCALRLAPLLFVRPGELRHAEWKEIDFDAAEWRIPAGKMKMREEHVVPLPTQAVAILRELQPLTGRNDLKTGGGRYLFPGVRTPREPMSENTINAALRRMGFDKDTMTGHGFRAMASTRLNELGWAPDVIERQLAHAERNKVRAAYNRAQYMAERRTMMQAWADYLDALKSNSNVTPIKRKAS